eukprot:260167_1
MRSPESLEKQEDLARIRFYGSTVLDVNWAMFGIECLVVESGSHVINGCRVLDGSVNGCDALFEVKKAGYGTFIAHKQIKSHKCLWNLKQSKHALKLGEFDCDKFIAAAKYGSLKVIKRSNSYSSKQYGKEEIQAIQTGFGYAVLHNHTKILTHFGSNNTSFNVVSASCKKSSVGSDYDDEFVDVKSEEYERILICRCRYTLLALAYALIPGVTRAYAWSRNKKWKLPMIHTIIIALLALAYALIPGVTRATVGDSSDGLKRKAFVTGKEWMYDLT